MKICVAIFAQKIGMISYIENIFLHIVKNVHSVSLNQNFDLQNQCFSIQAIWICPKYVQFKCTNTLIA